MKLRILICNDDGIYSPGIASLAKVASRFGDVRIVAPDVEQSSMGHAITSSRPLRYRRTPLPGGFEAYRVNGTPADCVALGTYLWERGKLVPGKDPMKRAIYWFTIKPFEGEEEGTDRWAFGKNFVSITPLRLDLTDERNLARDLALPITPARTAQRKRPAKSTKRNSSR